MFSELDRLEIVKCQNSFKMAQFKGHTGPWLLTYAVRCYRQTRHCSNHHPMCKKVTICCIPVKFRTC